MSILRIKGVKFVNRQHLKDQKQILLPNEYYEKLIGIINTPTKVTLAFKCGRCIEDSSTLRLKVTSVQKFKPNGLGSLLKSNNN